MTKNNPLGVPFSRYHQRVLAHAVHSSKPSTKDRDVMDAWVNMASAIGRAIMEQGGNFNLEAWQDAIYYGPKRLP